jgi:hypothetical protein
MQGRVSSGRVTLLSLRTEGGRKAEKQAQAVTI